MAKYTIQRTTETSSATFTVKANNDAGTAETSCQLKIQESPKISCDEGLISQRLPVAGKWKIEIRFSGFPRPEVMWIKNNRKITDKRISVETREDTSVISISSLARDDTASYTAKAANEAGSSSIECHLRVIGECLTGYITSKFFTEFAIFLDKTDLVLCLFFFFFYEKSYNIPPLHVTIKSRAIECIDKYFILSLITRCR